MVDTAGKLLQRIQIFVNGRNIIYLNGIETIIPEKANISIFPPWEALTRSVRSDRPCHLPQWAQRPLPRGLDTTLATGDKLDLFPETGGQRAFA